MFFMEGSLFEEVFVVFFLDVLGINNFKRRISYFLLTFFCIVLVLFLKLVFGGNLDY